jgi:hypothetical protein
LQIEGPQVTHLHISSVSISTVTAEVGIGWEITLTLIKGDIHWKDTILRNDAPYSLDGVRSSGTGGGVAHRKGFNLRFHFFFSTGGCKTLSGALASSPDPADLSLEAARTFSLSATTT